MNKKRKIFTMVFIVAICISMILFAVACGPKETTEDENGSVTSKATFANGDFVTYTGTTFPSSPTNWAAAPGSESTSSATPTGEKNLIAGVINTEEDSFRSYKSTYGLKDNPVAISSDNRVLMIYNKVPTSYKYTSDSVKVEKNKYYKLTINVKTLDLVGVDGAEKFGAYINLNGDAYATFSEINTNNIWTPFSVFIAGSKIEDKNITVTLSLGKGSKTSGVMTKGHAFFDDITLSNKNSEGVVYTEADYKNAPQNATSNKYNMQMSDQDFDFIGDSESTPQSPVKFTGKVGYGSGENASSSSVERGVVNPRMTFTDANSSNLSITKATEGAFADNMLMINNKKLTAYGYRAAVPMQIENAKIYKFSIKVRTLMLEGKGVIIKLTDGTDSDSLNFSANNINTNGEWQTIEMFITANDLRPNKLYLEMWAGVGGLEQTDTHFKGAAFFDDCTLEVVTAVGDNADLNFSMKNDKPVAMSNDFTQFTKTDWMNEQARTHNGLFNAEQWSTFGKFGIDFPLTVADNAPNVYAINNFLPNAYSVANFFANADKTADISKGTTLNPNSYYLISVWVKTQGIDKKQGVEVNLLSFDKKKEKLEYKYSVSTLSTLSGFNSANLEEDALKQNNGYTELKFYVQGNELNDKTIGFEMNLGSGLASNSSTHVMGFAFFNNFTFEKITSSEYSNATENSTAKKASLKSSAGGGEVSGNGKFNFIDAPGTESTYKDVIKKQNDLTPDLDDNTAVFDENGNLKDYLGLPSDWSISKKEALTAETNKSLGGILQLKNSKDQKQTVAGLASDPTYPANHSILTTDNYPNVLAIQNSADLQSLGFSSSSISLSENSYYVFEIWAKGSLFSIELATTSNTNPPTEEQTYYGASNTDWTKYQIYVQTGISSVSVKLSLYAGNPKGTSVLPGEVYFTGATYNAITKDAFEMNDDESNKNEKIITKSWLVDTFSDYTVVEDKLSKSNSWTANVVENAAPVAEEDLISGVFNKSINDWKLLGINPDTDLAIVNKIFNEGSHTPDIGNSLFALYQKNKTAYRYTSKSSTLKEDTYYKISIWALTYGLESGKTAYISLKVNNLTYSFGLNNPTTELAKSRLINTSTYDADGKETIGEWKEFSYYIRTEKGVKPNITLTMGLGYAEKDNYIQGRLFVDNFSVIEVDEAGFIARLPIEGEDPEKLDESSLPAETAKNNYRIVFTKENAEAEVTPEPGTVEEKKTNLNWLYITSGVIGGVIVVVVVFVLVKKLAPLRKKKLTKSTSKKPEKKIDDHDKFAG